MSGHPKSQQREKRKLNRIGGKQDTPPSDRLIPGAASSSYLLPGFLHDFLRLLLYLVSYRRGIALFLLFLERLFLFRVLWSIWHSVFLLLSRTLLAWMNPAASHILSDTTYYVIIKRVVSLFYFTQ